MLRLWNSRFLANSKGNLRNKPKIKIPQLFEDFVMAAIAGIIEILELYSSLKAINCFKKEDWKKAIENKSTSLKENENYTLKELSCGVKPLLS